MFSLIITIISIALVAALALATLYYGGSAFNKGSAGATAARLINEGQQMNGAIQVLRADLASGAVAANSHANLAVGNAAASIANLAPTYMSQVPANWDGATLLALDDTTSARHVVETVAGNTAITADVCTEVNRRAGVADPVAGPADNTVGVYGCIPGASGAPGTVYYAF